MQDDTVIEMPESAVVAPVSGGTVMAPVSAFDVRVVAEYDGTGDVVEWLTRAELICGLRGVRVETVLPLRLTGGAFAVWSQMPAASRTDPDAIKATLYAAFALDQFAAYDAFASRRLQPGEPADVYLADLRRLAELFGGVPERALACSFVAGLPETVRQVIRAGSRAESLDLASVLARARAVLSDDRVAAAAAAAAATPSHGGSVGRAVPRVTAALSHGGSGGQAVPRETAVRSHGGSGGRAIPRGHVVRAPRRSRERRCWTCGQPGHLAASCPGNDTGSGASAPAPFPARC